MVTNFANPSARTRDQLNGITATIVRVKMMKPHPRLSLHEGHFRYGIREINIFANKLEPGVAECTNAANSDDARDKYFVEYVSMPDRRMLEFAPSLANGVMQKKRNTEMIVENVETLFIDMERCLEEKRDAQIRVEKLSKASSVLLQVLQNFAQNEAVFSENLQTNPGKDHAI